MSTDLVRGERRPPPNPLQLALELPGSPPRGTSRSSPQLASPSAPSGAEQWPHSTVAITV
eukprot:11669015-Heterocapsa_arctica.AAC.1